MKPKIEYTIQQTYNDGLYFASSKLNIKKDFYISLQTTEVLRKLIEYNYNNRENFRTSATIANDTFIDIKTIEKCITSLNKKGYIICNTKIINTNNRILKQRYITINWVKLTELLILRNQAYNNINNINISNIVSKPEVLDIIDTKLDVEPNLNDLTIKVLNDIIVSKPIEKVLEAIKPTEEVVSLVKEYEYSDITVTLRPNKHTFKLRKEFVDIYNHILTLPRVLNALLDCKTEGMFYFKLEDKMSEYSPQLVNI